GFTVGCPLSAVRSASELADQHVREPEAFAFRQMQGHLVIEHALVEIRLIASEQRIAAEALVRLAHALQEHLREQALELLRRLLQGSRILRLGVRSEEHTSELQSRENLVCRLLLEKKKQNKLNQP